MINVKASGARTRISTFLAGVFVLILVVALGDIVALIPMAALVAVMIVVAIATFDWHSIRPATLKRMPISETVVMNSPSPSPSAPSAPPADKHSPASSDPSSKSPSSSDPSSKSPSSSDSSTSPSGYALGFSPPPMKTSTSIADA